MHITYDPAADVLWVRFKLVKRLGRGEEAAPGITLDRDAGGQIVGIEILDAAERFGKAAVEKVTLETFLPRRRRRPASAAPAPGFAEGGGNWVSVADAARRKGVTEPAVRQAIAAGKLETRPLRPDHPLTMVREEALEAWQPDPQRQAAARARAQRAKAAGE